MPSGYGHVRMPRRSDSRLSFREHSVLVRKGNEALVFDPATMTDDRHGGIRIVGAKQSAAADEPWMAYGPEGEPKKVWCTGGRWWDGVEADDQYLEYPDPEEASSDADDDLSVTVTGGTEDEPHTLYVTNDGETLGLAEFADDGDFSPGLLYFPVAKVWLDEAGERASLLRTWFGGDIVIVGDEDKDYSFKVTKTGPNSVVVSHGQVIVKGTPLTVYGWPGHGTGQDLEIDIETTTRLFFLINLAATTATFVIQPESLDEHDSESSFPAPTDVVYPFPIATITCKLNDVEDESESTEAYVILKIKEHRDVHLPGNT